MSEENGEPETTWPWRELRDLADDLYGEIRKRVTAVMNDAGEDPDDRDLYEEHVLQVAFSLKARAEEETTCYQRAYEEGAP